MFTKKFNNLFSFICVCALTWPAGVGAAKSVYKPDGYQIQTVQTPANIRFHITGLDSDNKGDLYVATRIGDVWRYRQQTWSKFASGLHEPTGLLVDDDGSILVAHKPQLTRLVDIDNDGIAEDYIHVASGWEFHNDYHEFNFGPVKDKQGYLHGTLNLGFQGGYGGYRGFAYKVSPSGEFTPYSWGLRSPAGIGIHPNGDIFYSDNQGSWVGTSKIHLLEEGKFYGTPNSLNEAPGAKGRWQDQYTVAELDQMRETPVVLLPHGEIAKSPGNPEWDFTGGAFGPFKGQMFMPDLTMSNIFRVMLEKVNGQYQGAAITFMNGFQSGNIRAEFDTQGQLWVGQTARGWGAEGNKPFGLQKVVWDGTNPFELLDIKLTKTGFKLSFTEALDAASVNAAQFKVQQWHYHYHNKYGSDKVALKDIKVASVSLASDNKSVQIKLPLTAGKVMAIDFAQLKSQSGRKVSSGKVFYTLNQTY
ncbi:PQQ-dependent sugar dehydrogenase [Gayadomonas joobiniege]|uniref:PQQ-dependent sugar dehydrogenase n=1 Tax=Gayadomonas joobiniege TaxID=1234606 RepID=UPI0003803294|nr:PQQ-dependent sugar dehydrogenase [Gayadomonas joobiniege]